LVAPFALGCAGCRAFVLFPSLCPRPISLRAAL
jgi:hypothetical protein